MHFKKLLGVACGVAILAATTSVSAQNNDDGVAPQDLPVGSVAGIRGLLLCNALINTDGTVAGGSGVNSSGGSDGTIKLGVGTYQVAFQGQCAAGVRAAQNWTRWVQPDTLTIGSLQSRTCITADRAGVQRAVWVQCYDGAGAAADTSFMLFIAR